MGCISIAKVILVCKVVLQSQVPHTHSFLWRFDQATKKNTIQNVCQHNSIHFILQARKSINHYNSDSCPPFFLFFLCLRSLGNFRWNENICMIRLWMVFCWYCGVHLMNCKSKMKWKIVINIYKLSGARVDKELVNKNINKYFSKYQQFRRLWQRYIKPNCFIAYIFV